MSSSHSRYAIITGGSSGICYEAARDLATANPDMQVAVLARTPPRALPANTAFYPVDLGDLASIQSFLDEWDHPVSALICCAGVSLRKPVLNEDGIDTTFAVNHVGHAALFFGLNERGRFTVDARIVFVSSSLHRRVRWSSAEEAAHERYQRGMTAYSTSKLANVLFANTLARKAAEHGSGWRVNTFDPGFVPTTNLFRGVPLLGRWFINYILPWFSWLLKLRGAVVSTPKRSGRVLALMAYDPQYDVNGKFFHVEEEKDSSEASHDRALQDDLWDWTARYLKVPKEISW